MTFILTTKQKQIVLRAASELQRAFPRDPAAVSGTLMGVAIGKAIEADMPLETFLELVRHMWEQKTKGS